VNVKCSTAVADKMWEDEIWDELLTYIEEERVVPILGPSLSRVEIDGKQTTVERYVAAQLALREQITAEKLPIDFTLNDVIRSYLGGGGHREELYRRVYSIIRDTTFTPPIEIRRLAQITNFKLFVTTTFDTLIEQALNDERFGGGGGTLTIGYAPNNNRDIDVGQQKLASPVVYHLLGVVCPKPSYVISDEDLLEFISTLQSSDRRPSHLFDELQNSHLLFLGCSNFSDWLSRFFLRTTKRRRLSDSRDELEIVADDCTRADPGLVGFLATYSTRTKVFTGDHSAFIKELWTRWSARSPTNLTAAPTGGMPDGAVFISYAREDFDVARNLWTSLEAAGISAWFDREQLMGGDDFEAKIRDNIQRCALFLPLLSRNADRRLEGFFRREWNYALDRDKNIAHSVPFIIPVVVDGTDPKDLKYDPPRFLQLHHEQLKGGEATKAFATLLAARAQR